MMTRKFPAAPALQSSPLLRSSANILAGALFAAASLFSGCKPSTPPAPAPEAATPTAEPTTGATTPAAPANSTSHPGAPAAATPAPAAVRPTAKAPAEIWKEFSGDKAFAEARAQVEVGPRPSGSPAIEKARTLIEESLRRSGWEVERQPFTQDTPHGPINFVNIIARFSATGKHPAPLNLQEAIVCSHYDTKYYSTIKFVGASDGASSTGALLELARVLAMDPNLAQKIELVFFDGEEAIVNFTEPGDPKQDGLWGSTYYAQSLKTSLRVRQFRFGILWDMIGARDLTITLPPDSPLQLTREILDAASALNLRKDFTIYDRQILDDHTPLNRMLRLPTIDLIDFNYPVWHTADDDLEHIGPESLQKVGAVTLYQLRKALGK